MSVACSQRPTQALAEDEQVAKGPPSLLGRPLLLTPLRTASNDHGPFSPDSIWEPPEAGRWFWLWRYGPFSSHRGRDFLGSHRVGAKAGSWSQICWVSTPRPRGPFTWDATTVPLSALSSTSCQSPPPLARDASPGPFHPLLRFPFLFPSLSAPGFYFMTIPRWHRSKDCFPKTEPRYCRPFRRSLEFMNGHKEAARAKQRGGERLSTAGASLALCGPLPLWGRRTEPALCSSLGKSL